MPDKELQQTEVDDRELLLQEVAIRKVLGRYGSALDWRDETALSSIVWEDAVIDYGFFKGSGKEWVHTFMEIERAAIRPFHMLVCDRVQIHLPYAEAESLGLSLTLEEGAENVATARQYWGRYLDRLEKRGQEWRICHRTYVAHGVLDVNLDTSAAGRIEGLYVASDLGENHPFYRSFR